MFILVVLAQVSSVVAFVYECPFFVYQVSEEVERALAKLGPAKLNARYGFTYHHSVFQSINLTFHSLSGCLHVWEVYHHSSESFGLSSCELSTELEGYMIVDFGNN